MTEPRTAAGRALMEAVTVDPKSAQFGIAISSTTKAGGRQ